MGRLIPRRAVPGDHGGDKIVIDTTASRLHQAGDDGDSNVL
jgi:hypothetical protein